MLGINLTDRVCALVCLVDACMCCMLACRLACANPCVDSYRVGRSSGLAAWCVRASSSSRAGALHVGQGKLVGGSRVGARQGAGDRFSREFVAQNMEKAGLPGRARTCAPSSPEGVAWALRRREAFKWPCNPCVKVEPSQNVIENSQHTGRSAAGAFVANCKCSSCSCDRSSILGSNNWYQELGSEEGRRPAARRPVEPRDALQHAAGREAREVLRVAGGGTWAQAQARCTA